MSRGEFRIGLGLYCRSLVCTTFYDLPKVLTLSARDARTGPGLLYCSYAYGSFPEFRNLKQLELTFWEMQTKTSFSYLT